MRFFRGSPLSSDPTISPDLIMEFQGRRCVHSHQLSEVREVRISEACCRPRACSGCPRAVKSEQGPPLGCRPPVCSRFEQQSNHLPSAPRAPGLRTARLKARFEASGDNGTRQRIGIASTVVGMRASLRDGNTQHSAFDRVPPTPSAWMIQSV